MKRKIILYITVMVVTLVLTDNIISNAHRAKDVEPIKQPTLEDVKSIYQLADGDFGDEDLSTDNTEYYDKDYEDIYLKDLFTLKGKAYNKIKPLLQLPEYPTGCESIALTALLKYHGFDKLKKGIIADRYLIKSPSGLVKDGFVGNPRSYKGHGCYANTMTKTANKFLFKYSKSLMAFDISGSSREQLFKQLDDGHPVLVWTTISQRIPSINLSKYPYGDHRFYMLEHCVVLTGYNFKKKKVYVMDPLVGNTTYNMKTFFDIYKRIGRYAMAIWDTNEVDYDLSRFPLIWDSISLK